MHSDLVLEMIIFDVIDLAATTNHQRRGDKLFTWLWINLCTECREVHGQTVLHECPFIMN